jgi:hypothetical protein
MNFDLWATEIANQMARKGHGFNPTDRYHSSALLALVTTEIVDAAQEVKRHHLSRPDLVAGELADALIRLGHFAAVTSVRFHDGQQFGWLQGFNDLGQQFIGADDIYDVTNFWCVLNDILWLNHGLQELHAYWYRDAFSAMRSSPERLYFATGLRRCVTDICILARRLHLDLDSAVQARTAYNESRPVGYNLAAGGQN